MSELQVIELALQQAAQRRRWAEALRGLWQGLFVGAVISLLLTVAWHLPWVLPRWTMLAAALAPFPCMLAGLLIGGWRKPGLNEVARWVDGRQHLQERLSTALEVAGTESGGWSNLVIADAASRARDLDPKRLLPFVLPRATRWALVLLALGAGLGFVPEYRTKTSLQKEKDAQNIREVGHQLANLTRRSLATHPPALETTQKALEAVAETGEQWMNKSLTRTEALKDLLSATEKVKEEMKDMLGKEPALKKLEETSRASAGSDSQTAAGLQKEMEALQKQLGSPTGNPEALDKLKNDLQKLQQAAKGLADKNSGGTQAERQQLSESLSALSKQMQDMGLQLPQLDNAIQALAANQTGLVLKDLQEATTDLEKTRDMAKSLQQLQQQMDKLGKDLAEQLKNGQPEAAQSTLQKMAQQLKSAGLPSEQLQKIMQEVSKAVDPAGNYGQVADKLKKAGQQMQGGNNAGASQSLADAANELGKLMQQMGDAQALEAELEALNQAASAIGTGQGWRESRGPGRIGRGGKPGSGVGTWADEHGEWSGQWSQQWDNSGADRPDMEARGQTERDADLPDTLKPAKVKGQFTPGGAMPSITLKGVSIKGQSKVDYEAAAAAAQSDAQSALSQDKVPRAYQGAVRDYFDDLKK
jgi:hypothetical protein